MKDTPGIISIACDGDKPANLIRISLTLEECVVAHFAYERGRFLESSSDAVSDTGSTV
ncbi:hypothetical protein [Paenibacillus foliorum]|uniref:hypothetical protein n=1 Tax=Paenibacillus foliorum TaxID=2654974 RepID=UPI001490CD88|nr:hypothetical protein [Paenibacillus foliorum]